MLKDSRALEASSPADSRRWPVFGERETFGVLRLLWDLLESGSRRIAVLASLSLYLQTLSEFAFLAALGERIGDASRPLSYALAALLARLVLGGTSAVALSHLGARVRGDVQARLWDLGLSRTGFNMAQARTTEFNRVLNQAPTDSALGLATPMVQFVADGIALATLATALVVYRPSVGLIAVGLLGLVGIGAVQSVLRGARPASGAESLQLEVASKMSWDITHGTRDIIINGAAPYVRNEALARARGLVGATRRYLRWSNGQRASLEALAFLALLGASEVGQQGLALVLGFGVLRLIPILSRLGGSAVQMGNAVSRLIRWRDVLNQALLELQAVQPSGGGITAPARSGDAAPLSRTDGPVLLVDLDGSGGRLKGPVQFDLRAQEWLQLHGPSGVGKSSVLDAIAGLWPGHPGLVRSSLAPGAVGYATQSPFLVAGSVRDNVLLGRDASENRFAAAAAVAGLAESLGPGFEQLQLLDRGSNISAGQRQRVSIARAVLRAPELLLLDEATANLDLAAEAQILANLKMELPDSAVLLVTHRSLELPGLRHVWI